MVVTEIIYLFLGVGNTTRMSCWLEDSGSPELIFLDSEVAKLCHPVYVYGNVGNVKFN